MISFGLAGSKQEGGPVSVTYTIVLDDSDVARLLQGKSITIDGVPALQIRDMLAGADQVEFVLAKDDPAKILDYLNERIPGARREIAKAVAENADAPSDQQVSIDLSLGKAKPGPTDKTPRPPAPRGRSARRHGGGWLH